MIFSSSVNDNIRGKAWAQTTELYIMAEIISVRNEIRSKTTALKLKKNHVFVYKG